MEITNPEQRFRYKSDFAAEYPRYRQLHQLLDQVSRKFVELESTLRKCDYGSDDFRVSIFKSKTDLKRTPGIIIVVSGNCYYNVQLLSEHNNNPFVFYYFI